MERHPTEQKILDEAIRVIEANGENSIRVQEIESAVGVTATSIYHFFGNREGLVAEAQVERLIRLFDEFEPIMADAIDMMTTRDEVRAGLHQLLTTSFDPDRAVLRERRLFALGSAEGRPELAVRLGEVSRDRLRRASAMLVPLKEKGLIRADLDLEAFEFWLAAQVLGRVYIELGLEPVSSPAWDAIAEEAIAFVLLGSD